MTPDGYDELVARSPQGSVFATSWWLDAVAGERWRAHMVSENGAVVAAWPTVVSRSVFGVTHAGAPLTPFLGPLFPPEPNRLRRRSRELKAIDLLLAELEPYAHLEARCHPDFDYWTPLHWRGFSQTTHYTWRLSAPRDTGALWSELRENVRREVRKAQKRGIVVEPGAPADLRALWEPALRRRGGGDVTTNPEVLARIDLAAGHRDARSILVARDGDGRLHASGYFVRDSRFAYYLVGASDPDLRGSGAFSLVLWQAIGEALERGLGFDFEGSMLPAVERFVSAFAGEPVPYSLVRRTPSRGLKLAVAAKRTARRLAASAHPGSRGRSTSAPAGAEASHAAARR